jgi:tripartite-type tricarboxylate transporter receptor subunit TctC
VQNAAPDGYSLLVFSGAQHAAVPALQKVSYDPLGGFEPITLLFSIANLLTVPATSPANSVSDLLELGRKKPGGLLFGAPGAGSPPHLLAAQIAASQNVPMQFVQYRGGAPMMTDLISGRIDAALPVYILVQSFLADRKVKVLAIDAPARWPVLADVPTLSEIGLRDQKVATWFAVAAPAGTPKAIVQRWRDEFIKASADAELKRKLPATGTQVVTSTSEELWTLLSEEVKRMKHLVSQFGMNNP